MAQANTSIDWEQRRYEVAKDVFVSAFAYRAPGTDLRKYVQYIIQASDILIEELKKR